MQRSLKKNRQQTYAQGGQGFMLDEREVRL